MTTYRYLYKCKACGHKFSDPHTGVCYCDECEQWDCVVRDYKAEAVGIDRSSLRD